MVGLTAAVTFKRRFPEARVTVVDKEPGPGRHASGRNSGVLHAGFYYSADSLKARLSRVGNAAWRIWCAERGVPLAVTGKLVVAADESERAGIEELLRRGRANGVEVREVDRAEARELEPRIRGVGATLWSPTTASFEPAEVMAALAAHAASLGVELRWGETFSAWDGARARVGEGWIEAGAVLTAAGLHADRVARAFGHGQDVEVVPFRGLYLVGGAPTGWLRRQVYPVPDLAMPFLGVHFTAGPRGEVHIGPTATPALGREHYRGLSGVSLAEAPRIAAAQSALIRSDPRFRNLALEEVRKQRAGRLLDLAERLAGPVPRGGWRWGEPGIRAQLAWRASAGPERAGRLVDDFLISEDARSVHVLNAVSPAFTCAWPFAEQLCERLAAPR